MPTIEVAVNEYLIACTANGLKSRTVQWYGSKLTPFAAQFGGLTVDQVPIGEMRRYLIDLRTRNVRYEGQKRALQGGLSNESLRGHDRTLRSFFNWAQREYDLPAQANPMRKIDAPRPHQQPVKAIALDDLAKLIQALLAEPSAASKRTLAAILFLADTGCRAGGMLGLAPTRLDLVRREALLIEKGDRVRIAPFSEITADYIKQWMMLRPPLAPTVFCSLAPNHYGQVLSLAGLHVILRDLKKKAGVTGRVNPHSLRHGFAREYLRNGGNLATLSLLMGHSTSAITTQYYARFTEGELAVQHDKFTPINSLAEMLTKGL